MTASSGGSPTQWDLLSTLTVDDDVTLVIRGHLILEALLNRLLLLTIPPACDELDRLRFAQKLDLAIAMGALSIEVRGAWRQVNALRNRFAHNLRAELNETDAEALLNAMPPDMRAEIRASRAKLDSLGHTGHRTPRALVSTCVGWLATFASRAVVERGGQPMEPIVPHEEP